MKIKITHNNKDYILAFTRKTARAMAGSADKLSDREDIVEVAEYMVENALKAEQPTLSGEELQSVIAYVIDNCQLVDNGESKGLLSHLNGMVAECLPKGFTKTEVPNFTVIE